MLAGATATISNSNSTADGAILVSATDAAGIESAVESEATSGGDAIGVTLAFNSVGFNAQNILFNLADAIAGTSIGTETPVASIARVTGSTLEGGSVQITAASTAEINANIVTATRAFEVIPGKSAGTKISVDAVVAMNKIATHVEASDSNAASLTATGGSVSVTSSNASDVLSKVSAASISIADGFNEKGTSVSVGISLSRNEIDDQQSAFISGVSDVTATAGSITISADEGATIEATSTASSIAVAVSASESAMGFSGGGATALNKILGTANAYALDSALTATGTAAGQGSVSITTTDTSEIHATVQALAVSVAVGDGSSVAIAIGFSLARNLIGWTEYNGSDPSQVEAYARHSSITAPTGITVTAADSSSIDAVVEALAVAVSAGTESGGSAAAGGLWTDNKIATQVEAYIDGSRSDGTLDSAITVSTTGADITIGASATGDITADARAGAVAANLSGETAVAIAIGLSLAHNTVADTVAAYLANAVVATTDPSLANGAKGNISITATDSGTISVSSIAVAVSVAAGLGDVSVGVAGGGSESTNVILTTTNAYLDGATVGTSTHPVGAVTITATSTAAITATVAAVAASISVSGGTGVGVALGVSVARNFIGFDPDGSTVTPDLHTGTSHPTSLINGKVVQIDSGPRAGELYQYIGPDVNAGIDFTAQRYSNPALWQDMGTSGTATYASGDHPASLNNGDTVKVTFGPATQKGHIFKYVGSSPIVATFDLTVLDYGNPEHWTQLGATTAAQVRAYSQDSSVHAAGAMSLSASLTGSIDALVVAGAVAVSGGGETGVSVSGAGVFAQNRTNSDVEAFVNGDGTTGISAASFSATATNAVGVRVIAGAVSVAVAVGGDAGVGVSLGLSIALNDVGGQTLAYVANANDGLSTSTGDVTLSASTAGRPLTGVTLTEAPSALDSGTLITAVHVANEITGGSLVADATNPAAALTTLTAGQAWELVTGAGETYVITWDGSAMHVSVATIDAIAAAASLAVGLGEVGVAVSGAGAVALNDVHSLTNAYLDSSSVSSARAVSIGASSSSAITATVAALSGALAAGEGGVAASVGISIARNIIGTDLGGGDAPATLSGYDATVEAYSHNSSISATGALTLTATAQQSIHAIVIAISVAISGGEVAVSLTGAGVSSTNSIALGIAAYIDGDTASTLTTSGISASAITLTATDTSSIDAIVGAASVAADFGAGGASLSIAVSLAHNEIGNIVDASIANAPDGVTTTSGAILLAAQESANIHAISVAAALAVSIAGAGVAVSGAGAEASNVILTRTDAHADSSALTSAGSVTLSATDSQTIHALIAALAVAGNVGDGAGFAIGAAVASNSIGYTGDGAAGSAEVNAYLFHTSVSASSGALSLSAADSATIDAIVAAASLAVSIGPDVGIGASGSGVSATNTIGEDVEAYIDGTTSTGVTARTVSLSAQDSSTITATAGAAALSFAFGGDALGLAISIGVAIGRNEITNHVLAAIEDTTATGHATVTSTVGAVSLTAAESAGITATTAAAAVAIGASLGAGVALAGAGAEATNVILIRTDAAIDSASVTSAGNVTLSATNGATITAQVISAAASLGVGIAGIGASIGISLARNYIGETPGGTGSTTYTTASKPTTLSPGQTVRILNGPRAGDVYTYVGATQTPTTVDLNNQQYYDPTLWKDLGTGGSHDYSVTDTTFPGTIVTGKTVKLANGHVMQYIGTPTITPSVVLTAQDYGNADFWRLNLTDGGAEVLAYAHNAAITATGALSATATSTATIDAHVFAISAAISVGSSA